MQSYFFWDITPCSPIKVFPNTLPPSFPNASPSLKRISVQRTSGKSLETLQTRTFLSLLYNIASFTALLSPFFVLHRVKTDIVVALPFLLLRKRAFFLISLTRILFSLFSWNLRRPSKQVPRIWPASKLLSINSEPWLVSNTEYCSGEMRRFLLSWRSNASVCIPFRILHRVRL